MNTTIFNNDLIIRDYIEDDYNQISELWSLTGLGNPERGDNAETIKRTLALGGKLLVIVSKTSGKIIGTSWMTCDGRRILLHHFGILPDFQQKGLSKVLLKESLKVVKNTGMQVKLEVHSSNLRAINLYNKFGFKLLKDYCIYIIRDMSNL
ncbi:MAG TPA: GNAT family N-acetyltransferase [Bacteroidales bacterium]|nr:GNAT family N-acetyltransferase [Bacteroidales bacterium]